MPNGSQNSVIRQKDDPVLRERATRVPLSDIGTSKLDKIIARMNAALNAEPDGVAIAAPQIGVSLRIFVVSGHAFDVSSGHDTERGANGAHQKTSAHKHNRVFINPEIVKCSKKKVRVPEGCLSVRWIYGNTIRHEKVTVRAYDESGKPFTFGGSGLIAQIFQHEIDHLDGILFIDHATDLEELPPDHRAREREEEKWGK